MIAGTNLTPTSVRLLSQFTTDILSTWRALATSRWRSPRCLRTFLMCSPRVAGSLVQSFGFKALSRTGTPGKKATRLCRCGRASEPGFNCHRGAMARCTADYQARLSGPLLDRIDLHIEVPAVSAADLILPPPAEGSREVAARVARARQVQAERYAALGSPNVRTNAAAQGAVLDEVVKLDQASLALIHDAADAMRLTARGYHRVLRVARTLADLDGAERVSRVHLAEALSYRALTDEVRRAA